MNQRRRLETLEGKRALTPRPPAVVIFDGPLIVARDGKEERARIHAAAMRALSQWKQENPGARIPPDWKIVLALPETASVEDFAAFEPAVRENWAARQARMRALCGPEPAA